MLVRDRWRKTAAVRTPGDGVLVGAFAFEAARRLVKRDHRKQGDAAAYPTESAIA
jgi:hypothetical protein